MNFFVRILEMLRINFSSMVGRRKSDQGLSNSFPKTIKCPDCGGTILDYGQILMCFNNVRSRSCRFMLSKTRFAHLGKGILSDEELTDLLEGRKISLELVSVRWDKKPYFCWAHLAKKKDGDWEIKYTDQIYDIDYILWPDTPKNFAPKY